MASAMSCSRLRRSLPGKSRHAGNARCAAVAAAATSAASPAATFASTVSSIGVRVSNVCPDAAGRGAPSMKFSTPPDRTRARYCALFASCRRRLAALLMTCAAPFDVVVQVVLLEIQHGELLQVQRDRERALRVQRIEMRRQRREQFLGCALLDVERPPLTDHCRHVDEPVVGCLVRDAIVVGAMRAHSQATDRKHTGCRCRRVELVEQRIERNLILDVGGILDDQVRQGESRAA